jgi:septal ring-binding cell division protein DamX
MRRTQAVASYLEGYQTFLTQQLDEGGTDALIDECVREYNESEALTVEPYNETTCAACLNRSTNDPRATEDAEHAAMQEPAAEEDRPREDS